MIAVFSEQPASGNFRWLPHQKLGQIPELQHLRLAATGADPAGFRSWSKLAGYFGWATHNLGRSVIYETLGPAEQAFTTPFVELNLNGRSHYVLARGSRKLRGSLSDVSAINFISGTCMFSSQMLQATSADGSTVDLLDPRVPFDKPIVSIKYDRNLSLYERETIVRLARFAADFASKLPAGLPLSITCDIPRVQYYFYLLDALERGLISRHLVREWIIQVDRRHQQLAGAMRAAYAHWFARVGLEAPRATLSAGLEEVRADVLGHLASGRRLGVAGLASKLSAHDHTWRQVLALQPPRSAIDLTYLSYCVVQLQRARQGGLTIAIENREELPTYLATCKLVRGSRELGGNPSIIGLYPLEQMFIANAPRWGLYASDPGSRYVSEQGENFTIDTLLERVYGHPVATIPA